MGMNREFAFYCPEIDCIVIQIIFNGCLIGFEWKEEFDDSTFNEIWNYYLNDHDILLVPLGEV